MYEAKLNDAEIQLLSSLYKAEIEETSSDRNALEEGGKRFWRFQEDWSEAYPSLVEKGLMEGSDSHFRLSTTWRYLWNSGPTVPSTATLFSSASCLLMMEVR